MNDIELNNLGTKISQGNSTCEEICEFISQLMPQVITSVNDHLSPRNLAKLTHDQEKLPQEKKKLAAYRTRLGSILEYFIAMELDKLYYELLKDELRVTFAYAHEYPDFFVRNGRLTQSARIEMKAVDAQSEEQAARFSVLQALIQEEKDVVLLIGWEWKTDTLPNKIEYTYPFIFSFVVVSASDLASERDRNVELRGGRVSQDGIYVKKRGGNGELTLDKGNSGKILRIIHDSRKDAFDLSKGIQRYIEFARNASTRNAVMSSASNDTDDLFSEGESEE